MQRPGIKTELFTVSWDSRKWFLPLRTLNWLYLQLMKYLLFFLGEVEFSLSLGRHFWQLHPEYGKVQLFWMGICFFRNALQQSVKKNYRKKEKKKGIILQCLNNTHHSAVGTWSLRRKGLYFPSGFWLGWISTLAQMEGCGYKGCGVWPAAGAVEGPDGSCSLLRQIHHSSLSLPQDPCDQGSNMPTYCTKGWHKIFKN